MDCRLVAQEHALGCGVACVASVLGKTYQSALKLFEHPQHAYIRGYYCRELASVLCSQGYPYIYKKYKPQEHRKVLSLIGTIVFTKPNLTYLEGHYWLKTSRGWMNPWANSPKINFVKAEYQKRVPKDISWVVYREVNK